MHMLSLNLMYNLYIDGWTFSPNETEVVGLPVTSLSSYAFLDM